MNRLLAAITPVRTAFLAVGLVVGVASGAAAAGVPDVKAPHTCTVAFTLADEAFVDYENQVITVHNRATRGMSEFAKHGREMAQLWDAIDEGKSDYRAAKASCLGEDS